MTTTHGPSIPHDEATTEGTLRHIALIELRRDGGTQGRTGTNEETIEAYTAAMREGRWGWHIGNALIAFRDADGTHWLADGFHRIEAAARVQVPTVPVVVRAGSRRDAVLYAAGANAIHGLRRTRADVRRAIETLLRDAEWREWSDREIARRVHCDHKTVAVIRTELSASGEIPQIDERTVSRNGSTYTQAATRPAVPTQANRDIATIATTSPFDAVSAALRKDDTKAAYAAARNIINNLEDRKRAFDAVDARVNGKSIESVLAMLEQPPPPALSAFPPGPVEVGIGAIARRLQSGSQIATDAPWAEKLRIQLDAARAGMQPAVYETWAARIGAVQAALAKLETQQRKIDLDAPIIEAPVAKITQATSTKSRDVLIEYAESMLAGVVEGIPDTALHLVAALIIWQYEPSSSVDPREALFEKFKMLVKMNIDQVAAAIQWQKG